VKCKASCSHYRAGHGSYVDYCMATSVGRVLGRPCALEVVYARATDRLLVLRKLLRDARASMKEQS
jgi:hypothetical protein